MSRTDALERYNALPLPTTKDEHWRFTDLKGFDPDAFGHAPGTVPGTRPERPPQRRRTTNQPPTLLQRTSVGPSWT